MVSNIRYTMSDRTTVDNDVIYTPVVSKDGLPGFEVYWPDRDLFTYIYMNPSIREPLQVDEPPNVFIYEGPHFDPSADASVVYLDIERWGA